MYSEYYHYHNNIQNALYNVYVKSYNLVLNLFNKDSFKIVLCKMVHSKHVAKDQPKRYYQVVFIYMYRYCHQCLINALP